MEFTIAKAAVKLLSLLGAEREIRLGLGELRSLFGYGRHR